MMWVLMVLIYVNGDCVRRETHLESAEACRAAGFAALAEERGKHPQAALAVICAPRETS